MTAKYRIQFYLTGPDAKIRAMLDLFKGGVAAVWWNKIDGTGDSSRYRVTIDGNAKSIEAVESLATFGSLTIEDLIPNTKPEGF